MKGHFSIFPAYKEKHEENIKWKIIVLYSQIFFSRNVGNAENSTKREMRKNCFSNKKIPPPPPPNHEIAIFYFVIVGNSTKREENMKYWKKFKQHSINIKNYTAHPHDMVHIPAKFWENPSMRFWVTVRKLNVTDAQTNRRKDRQTDGRTLQYLPSRAFGATGDNNSILM